MNAAAVSINATTMFLDGEDNPRPSKNEGSEEWRMGGDQPQYLVGEAQQCELFREKPIRLNASQD